MNDAEFSKSQKLGGASSISSIASHAHHQGENGNAQLGRAASWAVSFEKLLQDEAGLAAFTVSSFYLFIFENSHFNGESRIVVC